MEQFWITVLSIGAGASGYLITTFWVRPILRYGDIKNQIASNLILYANALDVKDSSGNVDQRALERKAKNREDAAQLEAICRNLPWWYKTVKKKLSENPESAVRALISLSNSSDSRTAVPFEDEVRKHLKIPDKNARGLRLC